MPTGAILHRLTVFAVVTDRRKADHDSCSHAARDGAQCCHSRSGTGSLHVADIVAILNEQPPETVARVFAHLPFDVAVELLDQPELEASGELLKSLPAEQALALLPAMSADRAADLFRHLEEPVRSQLLARLDPAARISLQQLLAYPPDTAGSLMTTEIRQRSGHMDR